MRAWLVVVALAAVIAGRAEALEFKLIELANGQRVVLLRDFKDAKGEHVGFARGDARRFEEFVQKQRRIDEVWFNSGGGDVEAGYGIGRAIRKRGLATRVPADAKCASACVDAFVGGMVRFADQEKSIGIHMGTRSRNAGTRAVVRAAVELLGELGAAEIVREFEQDGATAAALWTRYVMEMGVSIRIVDVASAVSANSMHFLTFEEMRSLNVVNTRE